MLPSTSSSRALLSTRSRRTHLPDLRDAAIADLISPKKDNADNSPAKASAGPAALAGKRMGNESTSTQKCSRAASVLADVPGIVLRGIPVQKPDDTVD
jgi:hypothetical protein